MTEALDNLERQVEREMGLLHALGATPLRAECLAAVQAAVAAEVARQRRQRDLWRALRGPLGAAAALLLAFGWASSLPPTSRTDPETWLQDWGTALDASRSRLSNAVEEGWTRGAADSELDDLFRSLDDTLTRFESL
ncbi:MAG: hypothetical protein AB1601_06275 [Planctomycetota bacterium]